MGDIDKLAKDRLEQLFISCDKNGTGFLGRSELRELCAGLGLGSTEADALFTDLDRNGDGRIDLEDFAAGFREFVVKPQEPVTTNESTTNMEMEKKRKQVIAAWKQIDAVTEHFVDGERLQDLEKNLLESPPSPRLIVGFKHIINDLVNQLGKFEKENIHLEQTYKREKEIHKKHLQQLEDEMDKQVKQLKESVHEQLKQQTDAENRALRAQLEAEKAELQAQLALFQSFGNHTKQDEQTEKIRSAHSKLEEAHRDNRQLRINLAEMQTNVAILRSDLAQLRTQYEDKCKELHKEKEVMFEYIHEHDHLTRQLHLLHEANKRLQDMNDHLRGSMDAAQLYRQMRTFRKQDYLHDNTEHIRKRQLARTLSYPESETNMDEITFGLKRFMEDIDSGMSTMRDANELEDVHSEDEENNKSKSSLPSLQLRNVTSQGDDDEPLATSTPIGCFSSKQIPERTFKVVFAGDANVGKSTFILHVSKGVFIPTVSSTLGVDFHMKSLNVDDVNVTLQLWDTAGQERFRSLTKSYFRKADGVMLLYDCTNERSFVNVRSWMEAIDEVADKRLPIMLCSNKTDLRPIALAQGRTVVDPEAGETLARDYGAIYVETSAKNGENILVAMSELTRQMISCEDRDVRFRSSVIDVGKEIAPKKGCSCGK